MLNIIQHWSLLSYQLVDLVIFNFFLLWKAEKAEGFIRLPDFSVDRAIECKKKQ